MSRLGECISQRGFNRVEPAFQDSLWGNEHQHPDAGKTEARSSIDNVCWDLHQPVSQQEQLILTDSPAQCIHRKTLAFDQVSCPLPLTGLQGMQDSFSVLVVLSIPEAGTMMQDGYQILLGVL